MKAKYLARLFHCFSACLLVWVFQGQARDLGTFGATFDIQELDLLQEIEQKLSNLQTTGKLTALQKSWQQQARTSLERPKSVSHIRRTTKPRTFYFDPSITVLEDFKDHKGVVFQKAGTRVNPLATISLTKTLLFLDGDDNTQVQWAFQETKTRKDKSTMILVRGSPLKWMEQTKKRFYFDQNGALVHKLGIQQVPARVSQSGLYLKVEEVLL